MRRLETVREKKTFCFAPHQNFLSAKIFCHHYLVETSSIQLYSYMWFRSCTHYVRPMVGHIIAFTPVSFGKVVLLKSQAHGEEHKRRAGSFHLQHRRPRLFLHPVHRHVTHWYLRKNWGSLPERLDFFSDPPNWSEDTSNLIHKENQITFWANPHHDISKHSP